MLSERSQLLLTAYVDGVLTARDVAAVERLLRESNEARALVWSLRDNARKVKSLPAKTLGPDFAAQVMARLEAVETVPAEPLEDLVIKPRLRPRGLPAWAVGGIAASLVGAVLVGGMIWVRNQLDYDSGLLPRHRVHSPIVKVKTVIPDETVDQLVAQVILGSGQRYGEPKAEPTVIPKDEPVRFTFADLQKSNSFDHLKWELSQTRGVHLEVAVKYNARSLNRVIESFDHFGIRLVVTPPAQASLAKNQPLLVYAENVPADKLALALKELGEIDVQGKKKEPSTFAAVRVAPDTPDDHRRIAQSLGIDPRQLKSPTTPVPSIASVGVVLPAERIGDPASISEIRGFLAGRGPVQFGALQVFLTLQPTP